MQAYVHKPTHTWTTANLILNGHFVWVPQSTDLHTPPGVMGTQSRWNFPLGTSGTSPAPGASPLPTPKFQNVSKTGLEVGKEGFGPRCPAPTVTWQLVGQTWKRRKTQSLWSSWEKFLDTLWMRPNRLCVNQLFRLLWFVHKNQTQHGSDAPDALWEGDLLRSTTHFYRFITS